jgi:hypothetical protein
VLEVTSEVERLARRLIDAGLVPASVASDALHIATASVHRVDFLVTWNFKHIVNPLIRQRLRQEVSLIGYVLGCDYNRCKSGGGVSRVGWASRPPVRASRPNELPRRVGRPPSSARPRRRMRRSAGRMPTLPETRLPRTRSIHAGCFPRSFPDDGLSWRAERRHPPPKDGSLLYLCTGFNHTLRFACTVHPRRTIGR